MLRTMEEIYQKQKEASDAINSETQKRFEKHLFYLNNQYETLFETLTNYFEYGTLKHDDSNQFILCLALLSDMLRKQRICVGMVLNGYYDEAADLTRHVMQSSFTVIYLSKNKDSWKEWKVQQEYEVRKLTEQKLKNPRTTFNNFKNLSVAINHGENYVSFQTLCSWSHPSIEAMRSSFDLSNEKEQKFYFTRRYNEEKAEYLLNWIYGFINIAIWEGFRDVFFVDGKLPDSLKRYNNAQEEVNKIFDKFYK